MGTARSGLVWCRRARSPNPKPTGLCHMKASCPRCASRGLDPLRDGSETVGLCGGCKGLFVSGAYARGELGGRDPAAVLTRLARPHRAAVSCPACQTPMTPLRPPGSHEVEIDHCEACGGYWLDAGELPAVKGLIGQVRRNLDRAPADPARVPDVGLHDWPDAIQLEANPGSMGEWLFVLLSGIPVEVWVAPSRTPWWTYGLIAACAAVMALVYAAPDPDVVAVAFGATPATITAGQQLLTLVTCLFVHGGVVHLLGNMYFLWVFGDNVEDALGRVLYPLFFVAAGVGATLAEVASDPDLAAPIIGASGAISALMGAYVLIYPRARVRVAVIFNTLEVPAFVYAIFWALLQVLMELADITGVAWWSHLGGLALGVAAGVAFRTFALPARS